MRLEEQIQIIDSIISKVCEIADVSIDELRSNKKTNILVAARVYIVRLAVKKKVVIRLIQDRINRKRGVVLHYLYEYKETFDYKMLKYKLEK
mgnify:FL=1